MNSVSDEVVARWRAEFESMKSPQAIQRDANNPERYWNDPIQYEWQGFLMARKSVVIELQEEITIDEINQVAADECQQDWDKLESKEVYYRAFIDGAKWAALRSNSLTPPAN